MVEPGKNKEAKNPLICQVGSNSSYCTYITANAGFVKVDLTMKKSLPLTGVLVNFGLLGWHWCDLEKWCHAVPPRYRNKNKDMVFKYFIFFLGNFPDIFYLFYSLNIDIPPSHGSVKFCYIPLLPLVLEKGCRNAGNKQFGLVAYCVNKQKQLKRFERCPLLQ